jgi:F420-0:gamma-glutamyl ligase-like protein
MPRYSALPIVTRYWKPKDDYLASILFALSGKVRQGDFVVVSEKAVSTALGNIFDESKINPGVNARFLAVFWMRIMWGYPLGILCHFGQRLLKRLRHYPLDAGSRHKQVALQHAGLMQALMFGSEGAIDGSNLPYSYVSLPLKNPQEQAEKIQKAILASLKVNVCVLIVDTDKTYKVRNFYFTPRPKPVKGIQSFGGVFTYVIAKALKLKRSSTPLAFYGCSLQAAEALKIANIADRARGPGSGATVWDMAARFQADVNGVSWMMLNKIRHKPLVIIRRAGA